MKKHLLLLSVISILALGCSEEQSQVVETVRLNNPPEQELFNYIITETENGKKKWVLISDKLQKFADNDEVQLFELEMKFYDNEKLTSTITSRRGKANLDSGILFAWKEVVVNSDDGRKLETEELHYNDETGLIYNDVFDRFTRDYDIMTGVGMEATPALDYFELKNKVNAVVVTENEEGNAE